MVLRKPYAFLIKHFKLFHFIMTILLVVILIKFNDVYAFISDCINNNSLKYNAAEYIDYSIYIFIFLSEILFLVIYFLLKYKDKPRKIYILSIACYILIFVFLIFNYSYMQQIINDTINEKTIRMYRDISRIALLFQYIITIIVGIRALGFDVKRFNFAKDVQELNLRDEDGEEIDINVTVDMTSTKRFLRKNIREFGYYYQEFKIYIIVIIILLLVFLGYKGYNYFNRELKIYSLNETFGNNPYLTIIDSYSSEKDNQKYIIVKFKIYGYTKTKEKLNINNINLLIGNDEYNSDKSKCSKFKTLGNCYKQQYISQEEDTYILIYPVDKFNDNKSYIEYIEGYNSSYKIKLSIKEY